MFAWFVWHALALARVRFSTLSWEDYVPEETETVNLEEFLRKVRKIPSGFRRIEITCHDICGYPHIRARVFWQGCWFATYWHRLEPEERPKLSGYARELEESLRFRLPTATISFRTPRSWVSTEE